MRSMKRLRSRLPLVGGAAVALMSMGVSRCGSAGGSTVTVSGGTLTIYASAPAGAPGAQDLLDAERLAFKQEGAKVGTFTVRLLALHRRPSDNARTAIQDTTAIAYLGEEQPGSSADSMGITEDQDLLQVSPADTAIALTRSTPAVPGAPKSYYESFSSYGRTFARVVPSAAAEARAQVQEMRALGVRRVYVADDGSDYGRAIAYAVRQDAAGAGLVAARVPPNRGALPPITSRHDALFVGASLAGARIMGRDFERVGGRAKLFVPSALASAPLPAGTYVSQPGFSPSEVPAAARTQFVGPFESAYGHAPATGAIFGYEAMSAVLAVLREAGPRARDRSTVVHDFFGIRDRASVLGTYSIDGEGDTSIAPFVFSRARAGTLAPFAFVRASP